MLRYIAGSLAATTATVLTYPLGLNVKYIFNVWCVHLDTAKARLATSSKQDYENLKAVFIKDLGKFGPSTFYRGLYPTLLGVIPYAGSSFFTYETCKLIYLGDLLFTNLRIPKLLTKFIKV